MADYTPLSDFGSGLTPAQHAANLKTWLENILTHYFGSAEATALLAGAIEIDLTAPTDPVIWVRTSGGLVLALRKLHGDMDVNLKQLKNARLEALAGDLVPAAGNVGQVGHRTATGRAQHVRDATTLAHFGEVLAAHKIVVPIALYPFEGPAQPCTKVTREANEVLLFDHIDDAAALRVRVPRGWDGTSDGKVVLVTALEGAETAGDDIDWRIGVRTLTVAPVLLSVSATNTATSLTDVGTDNQAGKVHRCEVVLQAAVLAKDATLLLNVHQPTRAEVGNRVIVHAWAEFPRAPELDQ